jgi:hypothetical protein
MMQSLLTFLLIAADPVAASAPAAAEAPAKPEACERRSGSVLYPVRSDAEARMAIDELGMPVDKKDKKGKAVVSAPSSSSSSSACPEPAGMAINEKGTAGTSKPKSTK